MAPCNNMTAYMFHYSITSTYIQRPYSIFIASLALPPVAKQLSKLKRQGPCLVYIFTNMKPKTPFCDIKKLIPAKKMIDSHTVHQYIARLK